MPSDQYRSKAAACLPAAETTRLPDQRVRWLDGTDSPTSPMALGGVPG